MGINSKKGDDPSGSPGERNLIAGDMDAGFFGEVSASDLITGDDLASMVRISSGISQFSNEGWLKFAYQGNIQFVAKKPIRNSISWNNINSANCVYGDRTIDVGGLTYKVRLMRGANKDPAGERRGTLNHGSEWNKLMLPVHIQAKNKSWGVPENVETDVPYWGIDFTDEDLGTDNYFRGRQSWCQEVAQSSTYRLVRGGSSGGVSFSMGHGSSQSLAAYSFRPVLELVL